MAATGVLVFLGCTPFQGIEPIPVPSNITFFRPLNSPETDIDKISLNELSPPTYIYPYKENAETVQQMISAALTFDNKTDTLPILFTSKLKQHRFIALSTIDFWKWDFWPLSLSHGEEGIFPFSEPLIATIKEMLLNSISGDFYAFPVNSMQTNDSNTFAIFFPPDISVSEDVTVNFSILNTTTSTHFDTTFKNTTTGSRLQYFKTKTFQPGSYQYRCEISSLSGTKYTYSDFLYVSNDIAEYHVQGQNTTLLDEFSQLVRLDSDSSINSFIQNIKSFPRAPIQDQFQINRTWILLSLLFLLFTLEWVLRKKYDLD